MRLPSRLAALVCLAACAPTEPLRPAPSTGSFPRSASANSFDTVAPSSQYRLITREPLKSRAKTRGLFRRPLGITLLDDSDKLILFSGRRLEAKASGYELSDTVGSAELIGVARAPSIAGGGFVFWSREGLYRSRTFLGRLTPISATPFSAQRVAFGPGFLLVSSSDGERIVLDAQTGTPRPPAPIGLLDIATSADGRVVAALELGRAVVSLDRNATRREVQAELGAPVLALSSEPLGFQLEGTTLVTLSAGGQLVRSVPESVEPADDPRWPLAEAPLDHAVAHGILRSPGRAWVAASAALAEVDLDKGELISIGPQLLPGTPDCKLLRLADELLMTCATRDTLSIVSQLESGRPIVEKSFSGVPEVLEGFGQVVVTAGCDGSIKPLSVCIRGREGTWRPLARHDSATGASDPSSAGAGGGAGANPEEPNGYALKADGGVVAFVTGARSGFLDLSSGSFTPVAPELEREIDSGWCTVELNGVLRCLTNQGPLVVGTDGKPQPRPFRYKWSKGSGPHALAFDERLQLFQSDDSGRTWTEVQGPPFLERHPDISRCSEVGCRVGHWLRLGWDARPPVATPEPEKVPLPALPPSTRPVLSCRALGAPSLAISPLATAEGGPRHAGFGNEALSAHHFRLPIEASAPHQPSLGVTGLRGVASGPELAPDGQMAYVGSRLLSFRWIDFFDAKARKQTTTFDLSEIARVAQSVGNTVPDLNFDDQTSFQVVPVLGSDAGKGAGFLLSHENAPLWVRAGKASALPLETADETWNVVSGVVEPSGGLVLLLEDGSGKSQVQRIMSGAGSLLFSMPTSIASAAGSSTPDAVGIASNGDLAVLHVTSGDDPPSRAYPLLAYRPDKPIEELAPWNELHPASDPACADKAGYRALLLPRESWLALSRSETDADQDFGMVLSVRWSKERVCVEALEVSDNPFNLADTELLTRVAASFGSKPEASRLGFAQGAELRQPLVCELRAP